ALHVPRQARIGCVHVAELRRTERRAIAARNLDAIEDIGERDHPAIGHVRVPALSGIGEADRLPVLDDVREDHHLGHARLLIALRADVDLEVAELPAEVGELASGESLLRKTYDTVLAESLEHDIELRRIETPGEIQALDARAQRLAARND